MEFPLVQVDNNENWFAQEKLSHWKKHSHSHINL